MAALATTLIVVPGVATGQPAPSASPSASPAGPRSLPKDLEPSLKDAPTIRPRAYADGCHAQAGQTKARACSYGDESGDYRVVLMGDSHAVQWLPALEAIAEEEGWHLYSLTKSACPVPDITVIVRGKRLRDCDRWRSAAFDRIADLHPDLVIAASLGRIYEVPKGTTDKRHDRLWQAAWVSSLQRLVGDAGDVVLLGDTPMWLQDPLACLRTHRPDIDRCDTPRDDAVSERTERIERDAATEAGAAYVPTVDLVCVGDPCPAVDGRLLVLGDTQHMTVAWARHIAGGLLDRLRCAVPGAIPVPAASPSPGTATPAPAPSGASPLPPPSAEGIATSVPSASPSTTAEAAPSALPTASPSLSCPT